MEKGIKEHVNSKREEKKTISIKKEIYVREHIVSGEFKY